jgi:hypothetical protein
MAESAKPEQTKAPLAAKLQVKDLVFNQQRESAQ